MRLKSLGPSLSEAEVAALEGRLGRCLPDDYRSFLAKTNGGVPVPRGIRSAESRQEWSINVLFGLTRVIASSNLDWNWEVTRQTRPAGYLPIAATGTGELVLLEVRGNHVGSVVLWQWQEDDLAKRRRRHQLHPLAGRFPDFLDSIGDV